MTKDDLQKETRSIENTSVVGDQLKEKVKPGVKPSQLKRSKSLNDLPSQESEETFGDASEDSPAELKQKISQLEDQILALRISKLKDFGEYLDKKQKLEKDLDANINYGVKEIEILENKLKSINRKKLELQDQLGKSQSEKARLELKLINAENKETKSIVPHSDFWTAYGPIILFLTLYALSIWLTNENTEKK